MKVNIFKTGILSDIESFTYNVNDNKATRDIDKQYIDWLESFVKYVKGSCCGDEKFRDEYYEKQAAISAKSSLNLRTVL